MMMASRRVPLKLLRQIFKTSFAFSVSLVLVFVSSAPSLAQQRASVTQSISGMTVAVPGWEPFGEAASKQEWLSESLRLMVTKDLSRISEINVVSSERYKKKLSQEDLSDLNPNDSENARSIAEATQADVLLVGTYQIKNPQIQLSAVFYNPVSGVTVAAHNEIGELDQIKRLETRLVKALLRKAGVSLGTSEIDWLERRKTLSPGNLNFPSPTPKPSVLERDDVDNQVLEGIDLGDTVAQGQLKRRGLVVGIHWPGASIGYQPSRNTTLEFRFSSNSDISLFGGRWNHHFFRFGNSNVYWGAQASFIDFVGDVSEGTGLLGGGFFGFEQYATDYMSYKADFGTYVTSLEDDETGVSDEGLGFVLNMGVALHYF